VEGQYCPSDRGPLPIYIEEAQPPKVS
jgi:hypothetical protein